MILRIIFLICGAFVSHTLGKMDVGKFSRNFEDMCFQNEPEDPFRVNGQETPLSNTLENFISLAEKFEVANPSYDLKDELTYFLSEYVFEDIKFLNGGVSQWIVELANFDKIDSMWDPDINGYKPTFADPFSNAEKCSLFHMISHSMLNKDKALISRSYSPGNYSIFSSKSAARTEDLNIDDYYPQEMGVVAIRGTDAAVSLSRVFKGLFVGLKPNRKTDINGYDVVENLQIPADQMPQEKTVDALFSVTLADVIMRAKWTGSDRRGLAPNGKWVSIPIDAEKKIDGFCPMVYLHQTPQTGTLPAYSYSSVRGAADGLILGLVANEVYMKKPKTKLSQLLRMYYSPDGITLEKEIEELNSKHVSFCERDDLMRHLDQRLPDQMKLYGYLIAMKLKDVTQTYREAEALYRADKDTIFRMSNTELTSFCTVESDISKPENLRRETNLDVIVVMDSSNSENSFREQQMIIGYLAKYLDLRYTGSQMTILLDQKTNSPSGTSSKIELKPVVVDTYSSSCAACTVGQIGWLGYEQSKEERAEIIVAIDQFLQERKENETKLYGANGKVVVYFNYESDNGRGNNKIQGNLEKALRELHLRHQDVIFYAVGLEIELLKKYAKNDQSLVSLATDGTYEDVAKKIFRKISFAPALLQYSECEDEKADRTISYESMASPHIISHYEMPAEYFYKSLKITFKFDSQNGNIRVCHNRATLNPEMEMRNCKNTTSKDGAEFKMSNPCKGFSKETCSPFYFSIMGMNGNEGEMRSDVRPKNYCNDLNDKWCATLDQVRFKVSHTGVRCSGCLGLGAPPVIIMFTLLLTYILNKKF